jgi:hypothetical protein
MFALKFPAPSSKPNVLKPSPFYIFPRTNASFSPH